MRASPKNPAPYADERRYKNSHASKGGVRLVLALCVGQPLERLRDERVVLFFAVVVLVRLRAVARFGEAFAAAEVFARPRAGVPFPFPFERERDFWSWAWSRCCSCARAIF